MEKIRISLFIVICASVFYFIQLNGGYFSGVTSSVSIGWIIYLCYVKILWKFDPTQDKPKIYGNYEFNISYKNNEGVYNSKELSVKIKQKSINETILIGESDSTLFTSYKANIIEISNRWFLIYTYISESKKNSRDSNSIHYGTAKIEILNNVLSNGEYWTSRETSGEILCKRNTDETEGDN